MRPSHSQLDYLDRLAREARVPVPFVQTMGEASEEIDWLQSHIPLRDGTRAAIFMKLKTSRQTKAGTGALGKLRCNVCCKR